MRKDPIPISRDIVLIGGGHSHVAVLKSFGMKPAPGSRLTLIARDTFTPYSGMLPGHLAGHYSHAVCHIDLGPLCRFAGARLYHAAATGLDLERRVVLCADRPPVPFDLLSIDIGSAPDTRAIAGAARHAIPVKPVDRFLERWAVAEDRMLANGGGLRVAVVGGGAGGVEVALSLRHRLAALAARNGKGANGLRFDVLTDTNEPLSGHAVAVRRRMRRALDRHGIALHTGQPVTEIGAGVLRRADGAEVEFDAAVTVTQGGAPAWLGQTGLALDDAGFIRVDATLQSVTDARVFAAGDIAALDGQGLPKSGVYAVRQGPVLADNLRRAAAGRRLRPYRPQPRTLALISTGNRNAVASYGPLALEGRWVWRVKDRIDRRWMRKYQELPEMADDAEPVEIDGRSVERMRCGGCGAKLASPILVRVLAELTPTPRDDVLVGLQGADDAAVIAPPPGKLVVQTVDQFRAFIDDPYLFGRVTANHCLGDIHAMGAEPQSALALVTLPFAAADKMADDLRQILAGALATLDQAGAALIGGHTGEGAELAFGLSVNGLADRDKLLRKGGLTPGDRLVLTKPLGTGAIFAADMRAEAKSAWVEAALAAMLQSNGPAAACLAAHGAAACTDVTGFGLAGHLAEMLRASGCAASLRLDDLPALPGATELLARGVTSSLHAANQDQAALVDAAAHRGHAAYPLLFDPQTAGGLLAGVPAARAAACLAALRALGYDAAAVIGAVTNTQRSGSVLNFIPKARE